MFVRYVYVKLIEFIQSIRYGESTRYQPESPASVTSATQSVGVGKFCRVKMSPENKAKLPKLTKCRKKCGTVRK